MKSEGFVIKFVIMSLILGAAAVCIGIAVSEFSEAAYSKWSVYPTAADSGVKLVIDAGHGGEDGGCDDNSLVEKEVNLQISENLYGLCVLTGIPAEMTRTEDTALYDMYGDLNDYHGRKKSYDLKNRLRYTRECGATMFVSIHMNRFSDPKYSGLQVYYSPNNSESQSLAKLIQSRVRENLQPENNREVKRAGSSIYLLKQLEIPAVLVECGFLSNKNEAALLSDEGYRRDLSVTVFAAITENIDK